MRSSTSSSDRSLRSRGRRGAVAIVAAFAAVQLALALFAQQTLEFRDSTYAAMRARLRARLANATDPVLIVALGSSRMQNALLGKALEPQLQARLGRRVVVFNFARGGAGPFGHLLTLRRLLHDDIRPTALIIEVMAPLLADVDGHPIELRWTPPDRLMPEERGALAAFGSDALALEWPEWMNGVLPTYLRRGQIVGRFAPRWVQPLSLYAAPVIDDWGIAGRIPRVMAAVHLQQASDRLREEFAWMEALRLGPVAGRAFRALLELTAVHGLPTVLVSMPEGSQFRSLYPGGSWAEIRQFADAVGLEHGARIVEGRDWFDDRAFADSHHLLPPGAELFTERVGRAIQDTLLQHTTAERTTSR